MAGVQATIPFRPRKKIYKDNEEVASNENKNILNIRKSSERKLKRNIGDDLKKSIDEGKFLLHYIIFLLYSHGITLYSYYIRMVYSTRKINYNYVIIIFKISESITYSA